MTTSQYLDSVLKIMPAIQARQIADLLRKLQVAGTVRNAEEYSRKLEELATLINDQTPIPSFNQIRSIAWYLCSSAAHNAMMESLKNDLEALFLQMNEIGQKVNDHHFLMMKNLISNLEKGLKDQENKINQYEWLAGQNNEFSLALVNSFNSASSLKVARSEILAKGLFFDNRKPSIQKTEAELPSAIINENAEKLFLEPTNNPVVYPVSVTYSSDQYSYGTEEKVDTDNKLMNLIDGTNGTYWTREILLSAPVEKVTTILKFDLGRAKDLNYVVIEGATPQPFFIESVKGIHPDESLEELLTQEIEVSGNTRIDFDRRFLKAFQITFAVVSYQKAEYYVSEDSELHELIAPSSSNLRTKRFGANDITQSQTHTIPLSKKNRDIENSNDIALVAREIMNTKEISDICNLPVKQNKNKQISSFSYLLSLDNVWGGYEKYSDSGIFVSKPLKATNVGILGIKAEEEIDSNTVSNSIEYQIVKRDNHPNFKEITFPIPYLGQKTVSSERLVPIQKEDSSDIDDVGILRFCPYVDPDWVTGDTSPVRIYKNGTEIIIGEPLQGFQYAIDKETTAGGQSQLKWLSNWSTAAIFTNYKLSPPKMYIKILNPDPSSIYTVNYTIRTSDTHMTDKQLWLDSEQSIFLSNEGRVTFRRSDLNDTIESDIYLQITLRRNTGVESKSPKLLQYGILASTYST